MKKILSVLLVLSSIGSTTSLAETSFTPNDELIYAVKGYKNGVAIMTGMLNPFIGLLVAAYQPGESSKDLRNIDTALARGAYINTREQFSGYTALIYGAYKGYPDIVAHLLGKGACPNMKEDGGYNAYTMAQYYVNWYKKCLERNESKETNSETRRDMRRYYQDLVSRYQRIVRMLESSTYDKQMPFSWWN